MLGGADNPNGELLSYIIGADSEDWKRGMPGITHPQCNVIVVCSCVAPQTSSGKLGSPINRV